MSASGAASVAVGGPVHAPITTHYYAGELNLYIGRRPYDITDLVDPEVRVPTYLRGQPSRLLAAANRIVDFYGREEEIAHLTAWRDSPSEFDVLLVHGVGGQGKSRLAMRFAELSSETGWDSFQGSLATAEFLLPSEPTQLPFGESGRLVVVDYAERWPVDLLCGLLCDARLHDAPTRVLLLARPAGNWWGRIRSHLVKKFAIEPGRIGLRPLPAGTGDRERLFLTARDKFAVILEVQDVHDVKPSAEWSGEATALDIQMAALAAVYASARDEKVPEEPGALSTYLLQREQEHWSDLHSVAQRPTTAETMGRAVYLACLAGPMRHDQASTLLSGTEVTAPGVETNNVLSDHRLCYPAVASDTILLPLRPDRISEDFIALLSFDSLTGDFDADPWTVGTAPGILVALEAIAPDRATAMLMRVVAVAQRSEPFTCNHLAPIVAAHPDLVLARGGPLLTGLADVPSLDPAAIVPLEARMPVDGPPDVMDPLASLTGRLYQRMRHVAPSTDDTVGLALRLGRRLNRAGRHAEAVEPIEAAVRAWRRPRPHRTVQTLVSLASALGCLAEAYAETGRTDEALSLAKEAQSRAREAGGASNEANAALAEALTICARVQHWQGHHQEAVRSGTEAAAILEQLAEREAVPLDKLASSLNALARYEAAGGLDRLTHNTAERAIPFWRQIVADAPGARQVDLLDALVLIAKCPAAAITRRLETASEASDALEDLWRRDITLLPRTAEALALRAELLNRTKRHDAARGYARRARKMAHLLAKQNATRHSGLLIQCDLTYARCCLESQQDLEDGLRSAKRAAAHAIPQFSSRKLEIDRVTAGLLRALGRADEADRLLGHTRTPQYDGSFERQAKVIRLTAQTTRPSTSGCGVCGGRGWLPGEAWGHVGGRVPCDGCWVQRMQGRS